MASQLDEAAVRHVAELARLRITDAEATLYARQLSQVLDYVAQLDELDTRDVPPLAHPSAMLNVLREDTVSPSWTTEQAFHGAPGRRGDFFEVPKVLDQESS